MKKILLVLFLLTLNIITTAQSSEIDKLKEELKNHAKQDTFRVNRLNELATEMGPFPKERKKYADEALAISRKIKYVNGQGFALSLLGSAASLMKKESESKSMFQLADSIADITGSRELMADITWRKAGFETDIALKDSLLQKAYTLVKQTDNFYLRANILNNMAINAKDLLKKNELWLQADSFAQKAGKPGVRAFILRNMALSETDVLKKKALFFQADSLAQKAGDYKFQANVNVNIAWGTKDEQEKKAYLKKAISYVEKSGDLEALADLLISIGYQLGGIGDKDALNYYLKAEIAALKSGNKVTLSKMQSYLGAYYMSMLSDYARAMEYFLKELKSAETANDTLSLITSWIDLGAVYTYLGDQDNSINYLLKAEEANKKLGNSSVEYSLQGSLGENYRLSGKYQEAIASYHKSIELGKILNFDNGKYVNESNLADVYTRLNLLDSAFYYGLKSLKTSKEKNDITTIAWIDGILSRAYLKNRMADSAIYYGKLGLEVAKETGTIEFMRDNTLALSDAYAAKKDFQKAYENHLLYVNYRDSMLNAEVRNRTAVQQYTFDLDKKEAEISVLHEQRKGQRNLLIGAVILLGLILAIAALLLRNNRLKQKANRLLEKQKTEIDEKAQELAKQKDNVELLSKIGRKITASLSVEKIIGTAYDSINKLMDANVFGIGIYNEHLKRLEFPATYENGEQLPFYSNDIEDKTRFGSVCFNRGEEIAIGDLDKEHQEYIQHVPTPHEGGQPVSIIFLPLMSKDEKLGVITVQSFQKNAYSDYQLYMFRNIATYAAIAIENAESYETLSHTLTSLKSTQTQLIHSEKMASLGELTAGIAHEIQNPLNFVNNFSEVSNELIDEMNEELAKGDLKEATKISADIKQNLEKINHHGKRAGDIVKSMLQHSRASTGTKEPTDINALADEYLRLSYHGIRAKDKSFNSSMRADFDDSIGKINIVPQDFGRVLLNLLNNAFFAVKEKSKMNIEGYEPSVSISTKKVNDTIEITVRDNGSGIPQNLLDKIFQPFFTTKPTGEGTGLGLSLSYDIIKAHEGQLNVTTKEAEFTEFKIILPDA